jgi:hypothetical protein
VRIRFGGGSATAELSLTESSARLHGANLTELDAELCDATAFALRLAPQRADDCAATDVSSSAQRKGKQRNGMLYERKSQRSKWTAVYCECRCGVPH